MTERRAASPKADPYRVLFDSNPNPLWVFETDTYRIVAGNDAALRQYGYSRKEFLALSAEDLRPASERAAFRAKIQKLRRDDTHGVFQAGIWKHARKDGTVFPVEVTGCLIDFEGREAALAMTPDVTRRLAAEEAALERERQGQVAQKMEAVGRLAGGVAHECNNVLTGIMGLATLIEQTPSAPAATQADAAAILAACKRAAGLVLRLLTFSQRSEPRKEPLDLNEVVARNRAMAAVVLGDAVRLEVALAPERLSVRADGGHLDQVLLNLCLNAKDAIAGAGRVRVATSLVSLAEPLVLRQGTLPLGRYAVLSIQDSGHGIPQEHRDRVFDPFFTTRPPGRGTGLGLSVAYAVARDHGGVIDFESEPGRGATFRLYLPCEDCGAALPSPAGRAPSAARGVVLVADDETIVRESIGRLLAPAGFEVLLAADGEEAVKLFSERAVEVRLVVLDIVMPKADGLEAYGRMRELKPGLPVLFMSGYATARARDAIRSHAAAFLPKPFLPKELVERIEQALSR
ncbi:MAG: response regulator [Elusimicrobia bacterium]|nr:response regulator [Elusimicrobiota bacterium]